MSPAGPVELRPTGAADTGTVLAMEADPDTRPWLGESGPGWHAAARADDAVEHLAAVRDGVVIGFVVLAARGAGNGTELRRIVIGAAHRGMGHGRAVLRAAVARVARRAPGELWLDVKPGNRRARRLYESEGFTVARELPADLSDPAGPVALVMLSRTV